MSVNKILLITVHYAYESRCNSQSHSTYVTVTDTTAVTRHYVSLDYFSFKQQFYYLIWLAELIV